MHQSQRLPEPRVELWDWQQRGRRVVAIGSRMNIPEE